MASSCAGVLPQREGRTHPKRARLHIRSNEPARWQVFGAMCDDDTQTSNTAQTGGRAAGLAVLLLRPPDGGRGGAGSEGATELAAAVYGRAPQGAVRGWAVECREHRCRLLVVQQPEASAESGADAGGLAGGGGEGEGKMGVRRDLDAIRSDLQDEGRRAREGVMRRGW